MKRKCLLPIIALAAIIAFGTAACNNEPEFVSYGRVTIPQSIFLDDTVVANTDALRGSGTIGYQWQVGDSATGSFTNIVGAKEKRFHVKESADITAGRFLRVSVTRPDIEGSRRSNAVIIGAERPRAFIDFSGYTGSPGTITSSQPPSATPGVFAHNGITGNGLRLFHEGDDGASVTISQHGGKFAAQGEKFIYFFIDHDIIKYVPNVTLELTFYDNASGSFNIEYVSTTNNFAKKPIPRSGANAFVTESIDLDNCNFGSSHNHGAQFRFPGNIPIQKVSLASGASGDNQQFAAFTVLNNLIGKGVTGYQAWFKAPNNNWHHWKSDGTDGIPGPGKVNVELWPSGWDEYLANGASLHNTDFRMHDNNTGRLFNSHDRQVIRTHLKWMQEAGIDGAAIQRFFEETPAASSNTGSTPNSHLSTIRDAAEEFGRIFYVMYDMSASGRYQGPAVLQRIQQDWMYNVENKVVGSPNYAQAEGKPVVCLWGVHANESTDGNRYTKVETMIELVQWFRARGYYIIGGIPDDSFWNEGGNRHPRGKEMYSSFDMISPWYIGRGINSIISGNNPRLTNGIDFCTKNPRSWANNTPIAFMPTIWPGFAWTNMSGNTGQPNATPRNAGQHIWDQVRPYLNHESNSNNEIRSLYLAMFDEYDEGTNWMKAGVDFFDIPLNQYFQTHSADGLWLSSDYYMRMAKASIEVFKRKFQDKAYTIGPLNAYSNASSVIVEHSEGPVYWRNSFERRTGRLKYNEDGLQQFPVHHLQIDVGVPNGGAMGTAQNTSVSGSFTVNRNPIAWNAREDDYTPPSATLGMVYTQKKSGDSSFRLEGSRTAGTGATYLYRIATTRIKASSTMSLKYWIRAENALGANVLVDLRLDNGVYVSSLANTQNTGSPADGWQQKTLSLPADVNNRYITDVIVAYRDTGTATGNFAACIDDITIANN